MPDVEIRYRNRTVERFVSDVNPEDEIACIALLRRRAQVLNRPLEYLTLRTWSVPPQVPRRKQREYRTV